MDNVTLIRVVAGVLFVIVLFHDYLAPSPEGERLSRK